MVSNKRLIILLLIFAFIFIIVPGVVYYSIQGHGQP